MPAQPHTLLPPPSPWKRDAPILVLLLVAMLPWWIAVACPFIHIDDPVYVTENPHVLTGLSLENLRWAFTTTHAAFYFPLTWLSLMLDVTLFGTGPAGMHATNVALHILNAIFVYLFFRRTTANALLSLVIASAWGLHPLRVESVAWVTERKDVLSGFFGLLALLSYVQYVQQGRRPRWLLGSGILMLLALLSKSMLVTLPFIMLLADFWPLRRNIPFKRLLLEKWPLILLSLLWSALSIWIAAGQRAVVPTTNYGIGPRLANACISCVLYLRDFFYFRDLALIYPGLRVPAWQATAGSVALLLALLVTLIALARRLPPIGKPLAVGLLWFFGALLPVLGIIQSGQQSRADRFTYFPAIGLIGAMMAAAWEALKPLNPRSRTKVTALLSVSMIMALAFSTTIRLQQWRDPLWLYVEDIQHTDRNGWLASFVGLAYQERGDFPHAEQWHLRALQYDPDMPAIHHNYGTLLAAERRYPEAIRAFETALKLDPDNPAYKAAVDRAHRRLQELTGAPAPATQPQPPAIRP